jgi:hypothetical protein
VRQPAEVRVVKEATIKIEKGEYDMIAKLKDGSELKIERLSCEYQTGVRKSVEDSFTISHTDAKELGIDNISKLFTEENISTITYQTDSGIELTRNYLSLKLAHYTLTETVATYTVILSRETSEEGELDAREIEDL